MKNSGVHCTVKADTAASLAGTPGEQRATKPTAEKMVIEAGILYKADGTPVLTTQADKPYRTAYRALFRSMGAWPPDGEYEFIRAGRILRPAKEGR
jgi:hypothetical protein